MDEMTSNKPYLIRGLYEWIVANELTPYLVVNAMAPGVQVPQEHVINGRIILNISPKACRGLHLENDRILFNARFAGGISTQIFFHPGAVLAIYAKENGCGMEFEEEEYTLTDPPPTSGVSDNKNKRKPALKLVKSEK